MASEGFKNLVNYNIDDLYDKTFHTYRKSKTTNEFVHYKWNPFNLVNKHYMKNADHFEEDMHEQDLLHKIYANKPNLVLNIGNEYLTMSLMEKFAKMYSNSALEMPKRHLYTRFVRDFKEFTLPKFDYCHYTVPLNTANNNGFVFPSQYVGQYGVYDAIKHVYNSSKVLSSLIKEDHLLTSEKYFATDMEKAIEQIRADFRAKNKIAEDAYSIFVAPGNEKNEVVFCMENLRKGVKEFLLKYSAPTSLSTKALPLENFVTVLSLEEGSEGEKFVKEYLKEHEWHGRLLIVSEKDNQYMDAMAASDYGLIYDGMMVS
mmetsp:Transcript_18181/g.31100  ORF Transcript_18181/g.31100 Transcript_18181/m.31100 type:complete len:316 (-) Transcript_18181:523-1470(-)